MHSYNFPQESGKGFALIGGLVGTPFGPTGTAVGAKVGYVVGFLLGSLTEAEHFRHTFYPLQSGHSLNSIRSINSSEVEGYLEVPKKIASNDDVGAVSEARPYKLKKRLKRLIKEELCLDEKPKMSDYLRSTLGADNWEIRQLKEAIYNEFGVKIKKKYLESCLDVRDIADLIIDKYQA